MADKKYDSDASKSNYQPNQCPEDMHGPGYDNDTKGWVRGQGQDPDFDKKKPGK